MNSNQSLRNKSVFQTTNYRRTALASACVALIAGFSAPAGAQSFVYTLTNPSVAQTYTPSTFTDLYLKNDQWNQALLLTALNSTVFFGVQVPSGSPIVVTGNSATAIAGDNLTVPASMIDLALMQALGGSAGLMSGQLTSPGVITSARNTNIIIGVQNTAQAASVPVTVGSNTIQSQTRVNDATNIMNGQLPIGYTSAATGSISSTYNQAAATQRTNTTAGSIGLSNNQTSLDAGGIAGATAAIDGSSVTIDMQQSVTQASGLTLTNNSLSAAYNGNIASNSVAIGTGGATSLAGSIGLVNTQSNRETAAAAAPAPDTASVTTSAISANLQDRSGAASTTLNSALVVSDNSISAASVGNAAGSKSATGIVAGNSIVLAQGIDVTGTASGTANTLSNTSATQSSSTLNSSVALLNEQRNDATLLRSTVSTAAGATTLDDMQAGAVKVNVDVQGANGRIDATGNSVAASVTGNLAGNLVSANNTTYNATTAVGNAQVNNTVDITATNLRGGVTVNVGNDQAGVTGITAPVTMTNNTVSASADGSVAGTTIDIKSTNFTAVRAAAGAGQAVATGTTTGSAAATSGTTVTNLQLNTAGNVTSDVTNAFVAVNARDNVTAATPTLDIIGTSVTSSGNSITSAAAATTAGNQVSLSGSNGTLQAGVANTQINGSAVSSGVTDSGVSVQSANITSSNVTIGGNTVSSTGRANDATNSVSASFSNLTTGPNGAAATAATVSAAGVATVNAALAVANSQVNTGLVSSNVTSTLAQTTQGTGFATVYAGGPEVDGGVAGSVLSVTTNNVTATTSGNRATNAASFQGALTTTGNLATNIAAVGNSQINTITGVADATVDGGGTTTTAVGVTFNPTIAGSVLTVATNNLSATTTGNQATNSLSALTGSITSGSSAASGVINTGAGTVGNELAISSRQNDSATAGRTATVTGALVGVANATTGSGTSASITGSVITVDRNTLTAEARNNDASNSIPLANFSTLNSGAGVSNSQTSSTNVAANVTDSAVSIRIAGDNGPSDVASGSTLNLTNNTIKALAVGSSANNSLTASATNLSGNAANATSGATSSVTPTVTADYGIGNSQTQTGTVSATTTSTVRVDMVQADSTATTVVTGNNVAAVSQATSAVNTLTLNGTGGMTAVTGAIGSGQTSTGAITATATPETGNATASVIGVAARTIATAPVTVSNNTITASAGRNEAFSTLNATGATITGAGLASSNDFAVVNNQQASGDVTSSANPGLVGIAAESFTGQANTVTTNRVLSNASQSNTANALNIAGTAGVSASGTVNNQQDSNTGVVTANLGTPIGLVAAPASVGIGGDATVPAPVLSGATFTVDGNSLQSQAMRNSASNTASVTGATVAGTTGAAAQPQSFSVLNTQNGNDFTAATTNATTIGAVAGAMGTSTLTVTGNTARATAGANTATNGLTIAASGAVTGSGIVANTQTASPASTVPSSVSSTTTVTTVGLASSGATGLTGGDTVTVGNNNVSAQSVRNAATNTVSVAGSSITGSTPAAQTADFIARNTQTSQGTMDATTTVTTVGVTAPVINGASNVLTVADNTVSGTSRGNSAATSTTLSASGAVTGTGIADNTQSYNNFGHTNGTVTATTVGVEVTGAATSLAPVVSGNALRTEAIRNTAATDLSVTGGSIAGGAPINGNPASYTARSVQSDNTGGGGNAVGQTTFTTIGTTTGSVLTAGTFTTSGNTASSLGRSNDSETSASLDASGAVSGSARAMNTQTSNAAGSVESHVLGTVIGLSTGPAANITVTTSGNTVSADTARNASVTTLTVNGASLAGAAVGALAAGTPSSFTADNTQNVNQFRNHTATVNLSVVGAATNAVTGTNTITVANNAISAITAGNNANTSAQLTAAGAVTGSGMARSNQFDLSLEAATAASNAIGLSTNGFSANNVTAAVAGNSQVAQGIQDLATTSLGVTGNSITGDTALAAGTPASFTAQNIQFSVATVNVTSSVGTIGITEGAGGGLTGTNSLTVDGNTVQARSRGASADTSATLTASAALAGSGMASNSQTHGGGNVNATATATNVGIDATAAVNNLTETVAANRVAAEATVDVASTRLQATGSSIAGTAAGSLQAGTPASFTATNLQNANMTSQATATGSFGATLAAGLTGANSITVDGNSLTASVGGTSANTAATIAAAGSLTGSGMATSDQTSNGVGRNATANSTYIGLTTTTAGATGVTVSGNSEVAQAGQNSGTTTLNATGATIAGDTVLAAGTPASFTARSTQNANGTSTNAFNNQFTVGERATVASGNTVVVTDNTLSAIARTNAADTSASVVATSSLTGSAMASNSQTMNGNAQAVANNGGSIVGEFVTTLTNTNATVDGNTLQAEATRNTATTAAVASGATVTGAAAAALTAAGAPASFTANSVQTSNGSTSFSLINQLIVGVRSDTLTGANTTTVSDNTIAARAGSNSAVTTADLNGTASLAGTGLANNQQTGNGNGVSQAIVNITNVGVRSDGGGSALTAAVTGNAQLVQGINNLATTRLTAQGGVLAGDTALVAGTQASFSAVNQQSEAGGGAVVFLNNGANVTGVQLNAGGATSGSLNVSANSEVARARDNSADTSAALTATGDVSGSGMAANTQSSSTANLLAFNGSGGNTIGVNSNVALNGVASTVSGNLSRAEATRNVGATSLQVQGASVTGTTVLVAGTPASFTATSTQTDNGSSITASDSHGPIGTGVNASAAGSTFTTSDNEASARAGANSARTSASVAATGAVSGTVMSSSTQFANTGTTINATESAFEYGTLVNGGSDLNITTSRNTVLAQSQRNEGATTLNVAGASIAGATPAAGTPASFVASNTQSDTAGNATLATVTANNVLGAYINGNLGGAANTLTVSDNLALARSRSNTATTGATLTATGAVSGSAQAASTQSSTAGATVQSQVQGFTYGVFAPGTNANTTITVSANTVEADATLNAAATSLSANGASLTGTVAGSLPAGTNASFTALNTQSDVGGGVLAQVTPTFIGAIDGNGTGGGAVTVTNNVVDARAHTNAADTSVALASPGNIAGSALGVNSQTSAANGTANQFGQILGVSAGTTTNVPLTVSGNQATADARLNVATDQVGVTAGSVTGEATLSGVVRPASIAAQNSQVATGSSNAVISRPFEGVQAGNITGPAAVTISGNTNVARVGGNSSVNGVTVASASGVTGSAMTDSTQSYDGNTANGNATVTGSTLGLNLGNSTNAPTTVNGNTAVAQAVGNAASNATSVSGASITGAAAATLPATTPASFTTRNVQAGANNEAATSAMTFTGIFVGGTTTGAATAQTVSDNLMSAQARNNSAGNSLTLDASSTLSGSGITDNSQTSTGSATSTVAVGGTFGFQTGTQTSQVVTVSGNTADSTAIQNAATNSLTATGASVAGDTVLVAGTPASFTTRNVQDGTGATATNAIGTLGVSNGATTGAGNVFTITGNTQLARAGTNTADNRVTLTPTSTLTGTGMVDNSQTADTGPVLASATTNRLGQITGNSTAAPVTVSNNVINADAARNNATNVLNAQSATIAGAAPVAGTPASFNVRSVQSGNDDVTAQILAPGGLVGAQNALFGAGSTFGVVDNTVLANARVNAATNQLLLNAGSALSGTGNVTNTQTSGTIIPTTVTGIVNGMQIGVISGSNNAAASTMNVSGNVLAAQGGGNTALNALEATAAGSIGGSVFPTYGVLNSQNNNATVNMTVTSTNVGAVLGGSTATSAVVTGNTASALGYGNAATNTLLMSANGPLNSASAMVSNSQINTASITSTVSNANIGMVNAGGSISGSSIVTNNSITARAIGNSAANTIGMK